MTVPTASVGSNLIHEELYLSPGYPSREALESAVEMWDSSNASQIARCARNGQYSLRYGLRPIGESYPMLAGSTMHAALALFYAGASTEVCMQEIRDTWGHDYDWRLPPGHRYAHLHLGFLEVVFKNYTEYARKRDTFKPIVVQKSDLDLEHVVAAIWRVTEEGHVVLGESKIIMRYEVQTKNGPVPFVYCGKPDLPITMGGQMLLLDHKCTNSYLSDYYFEQYRFSNQLRGYCSMIERLLHRSLGGALINGIYIGEKATDPDSKATRFARFGPMMFQPEHLTEAIQNQYYWRQYLDACEQWGYYPQHTSKLCSGCSYAPLCNVQPSIRESVMLRDYTQHHTPFLDI